jgi:glycine cleavage system aminomethyltransferase T
MALVEPASATEGKRLEVEIRGHHEPALVVSLPFYRRAERIGG